MKNKLAVVFTTLALVLAISAPLAAQANRVTANIPFEFSVAGKVLPAGEYAIRNGGGDVLLINGLDNNASALVLSATSWNGKRDGATAVLTFNRYGDSYFLSRVWNGYSGSENMLPVTRTEKELSRTASVQKFEILAFLAQR